jgi:hypothetical protein
MAIAGLVVWSVTLLMGIVTLTVWLRKRHAGSRFPTVIVVLHIVTALLGLFFWIGFVMDGQARWAWTTFVVMNVNNLLGDAILTGRFRALSGTIGSWWRDYAQAIRSLLRGQRPKPATLHASLAGVTYVVVLIACLQTL